MKYVKTVGLFLFIACAFAAMTGVSTASAAFDQGLCVAQKNGKYGDAGCATLAAKKGKFDFHSADSCYAMTKGYFTEGGCKTVAEKKGKADHKGSFELAPSLPYESHGGQTTLNIPGAGSIDCESSTGKGLITGSNTGLDQMTFFGCSTKGNPCSNSEVEGQLAIRMFTLETNLKENAKGEAVAELVNDDLPGAPFSSEFECSGVTAIRTKGFTDGLLSPVGVMRTTQTTKFAGELNLKTEFVLGVNGMGEPEWSGGTGGGPNEAGPAGEFPSEGITESEATYCEATEIHDPTGGPAALAHVHAGQRPTHTRDARENGATPAGAGFCADRCKESMASVKEWEGYRDKDWASSKQETAAGHPIQAWTYARMAEGDEVWVIKFQAAEAIWCVAAG